MNRWAYSQKYTILCPPAGHVEDVVVHTSARGTGLGKLLLDRLTEMATASGCYKIILNCAHKNIGFYEKCGLVVKEVSMAKYLDR